LPYLKLKQPQARLALEIERIRAALPRTNNGGAEWTPRARAECEAIKQKIHSLNARGPAVKSAEDTFLPNQPIAEWNPRTQLWETSQMDLFSEQQAPYSLTWPTSGMTVSGRLYPLPRSELRMNDSESLSSPGRLPTPVAVTRERTASEVETRAGTRALGSANLDEVVIRDLLPTPNTMSGGPQTPEARAARGHGSYAEDIPELLPPE